MADLEGLLDVLRRTNELLEQQIDERRAQYDDFALHLTIYFAFLMAMLGVVLWGVW